MKKEIRKRIWISCAIILILIFGIIAFSFFSITGNVVKYGKSKPSSKFYPKQKTPLIHSPIKSGKTIYQEIANEKGVYNGIQGIDNKGYIFVNYTKPEGFSDSISSQAIWIVKHGNLSAYNITIPNDCKNVNKEKLILRIYTNSNNGLGKAVSQPQCYNGTIWKDIGNLSSGMYTHGFYNNCDSPQQGGENAFDDNWNSFSDRLVYSCSRNGGILIHEAKIMDGDVYSPQPGDYLGGLRGPSLYDRIYEEAITWILPNCTRGNHDYVFGPACGVDGLGGYCGVNEGICYWSLQTCDLSVGGLCYMNCINNNDCNLYRTEFENSFVSPPLFKCLNKMCVECTTDSECYNRWDPYEWRNIDYPVCDSYHFCTEKKCLSNGDCNFPVTLGTNWFCNVSVGNCARSA